MEELRKLYVGYYGIEPDEIRPIAGSASNRQYYRLSDGMNSCIGVIGNDLEENRAFRSLARHFKSAGLPVPELYAVSEDEMTYIQEDLGAVVL